MYFLIRSWSLLVLASPAITIFPDDNGHPLHQEKFDNVVFYEKSAFIYFDILSPLNNRSSSLLTADAVPPYVSGECTTVWDYHCPLWHYFLNIRDTLRGMISVEETQRKLEPTSIKSSITSCGQVEQRLFSSLYTPKEQVDGTKELLKSCPFHEVSIMEYDTAIGYQYTDSLFNYTVAYPRETSAGNATAAIVLELLNTLGFLHQFADKTMWEIALDQCKNHRIVSSLITAEVLKQSLLDFKPIIESKGYRFAINPITPADGKLDSSYWTIPSTDCTYTSNGNNLHVVMAVPIVKNATNWTLRRLTTLPFHTVFAEQGYVCYVPGFEDEPYYAFEENRNIARRIPDHEIENGSFLKFLNKPKGLFPSNLDNCASTLLRANDTEIDIVRNCQLDCVNESEVQVEGDLIVKRVSSNTFYISKTNSVVNEIRLSCGSGVESIQVPAEGAVKVRAPCGCKFQVGNVIIEEVEDPCSSDPVEKLNVVPIHIRSKFKPMTFSQFH